MGIAHNGTVRSFNQPPRLGGIPQRQPNEVLDRVHQGLGLGLFGMQRFTRVTSSPNGGGP